MEFMIAEDVGLCRFDGTNYESYMVGGVWGFNGFAYGAFKGFENGRKITRAEALSCLINECDVAPDKAEYELEKQGLGIEETIQHLVDAVPDFTVADAQEVIGLAND